MNVGRQNLIEHMRNELDYFKHDEPEHYEEVKAYFLKIAFLMEDLEDEIE